MWKRDLHLFWQCEFYQKTIKGHLCLSCLFSFLGRFLASTALRSGTVGKQKKKAKQLKQNQNNDSYKYYKFLCH